PVEQPRRGERDLLDGTLEDLGVRLRGLRRAADLAYVLQRRVVYLAVRRGRLEVVECSDVSAHVHSLPGASVQSSRREVLGGHRLARPPRPTRRWPSPWRACRN